MKAQVLVVDDNRELAENICEILESFDELHQLRTHIADNAHGALAVCDEIGPALDVAIVDLRLPDADGMTIVSEVRARCPFAEVVIITGDATIESAIQAVERGAFAFVLKPFRSADLLRGVSSALGKVSVARERERFRAELQLSERQHREIVDAIPAFVLALDEAGRVLLWNRQLEQVTGFTREDMIGHPGRDLVQAGADRKLQLKSGDHRLVRWQYADVVRPTGDRVTYALGIDVTDERAMLRRTLRAERLAAVGTLAAGLAHEVRNPLNSALLQLEVLKRRVERGSGADALFPVLSIVQDEIRRLERLVNDFLAFAQPRPTSYTPTNVNQLVESVITLIKPEAETLGIEVRAELDPQTGSIEAAPERMRQVLLNLTRNALEAMSESGTLTLCTTRADSAGNVAIAVEDTGPGFPEEAPVFDAFYTTKASGTGLGLAIVHRIVGEHSGTIAVDSRPGATKFIIRLPQQSGGAPGT
jgi:PAS domain S-box-containing protein